MPNYKQKPVQKTVEKEAVPVDEREHHPVAPEEKVEEKSSEVATQPQGDHIEDYDPKTLMPLTIQHKLRMANVMAKSGLLPKGLDTPQKVFIALQMGHELGLRPMVAVNNIAVVNGKPSLSTDLVVAIVRQHPEYAGMKIEQAADHAKVTFKRKHNDSDEEFSATFTLEDAKKAGLMSKDNWQKYPTRMMKHRATAFAARDAFPDAIAGMYTAEEMDTIEGEVVQEPINQIFDMIVSAIEKESDPQKKKDTALENVQNNKVLTDEQREALKKYLV